MSFLRMNIYCTPTPVLSLHVKCIHAGAIFAYGQTSSGKTHTMTGNRMHPGIIPLAFDQLFTYIDKVCVTYIDKVCVDLLI